MNASRTNLPTVELVDGKGTVRVVNESDIEMWKAKGFKLAGAEPAPAPAPEPEPEGKKGKK